MLVYFSGTLSLGDSVVQSTAVAIVKGKTALPLLDAIVCGILCNVLVCFAVWMSFAAHYVASKVITIVLTVTAFVAHGFEQSVATIYFIPVAMLAGTENIDIAVSVAHLLQGTLGNTVSGGVLVAVVLLYLPYPAKQEAA